MARICSPFTEPVRVPWLGDRVVDPDEVVEIPDDLLPNFVAGGWKDLDSEDLKPAAKPKPKPKQDQGDDTGKEA